MVSVGVQVAESCVSIKLKTGVVGAGVFGSFHAAKHAASARGELAGIFDIDVPRARSLAERYGAVAYSELGELLENVDALTVASPAPTHFRLASAALEAGRHVYVEKPLAMSVDDADALIALAESKSLVLQVGHQERFALAAMGLPRRGHSPSRLEFSRCGPASGRGEDVSVVYDLMIHDLDIARLFGFGRPATVSACGDGHETIANLGFEGGRSCSFIASRRTEFRRRILKAAYEDGVIEIDFLNRRVANSTSASLATHGADDPLQHSIEAFFASILDAAPTMIDGKAGRGAIELAAMIEEARDDFNASKLAMRRTA